MNFWPIDDNLIDVVAGANMTQNGFANFANDRFQNVASAINFNGGSYSVPSGVYFSGDFTVSVWGNQDINGFNNWPSILCFTNWVSNALKDTICLQFGNQQLPYFHSYSGNTSSFIISTQAFNPNTWTHFAFTLNGNNGSIYINGVLASTGYLNVPNNVVRTLNTFGTFKGLTCYAKIDFIKFYNRSLSSTEIQTESKQIFQKISN